MKLKEMLDDMVVLSESGNSDCVSMAVALQEKLTPAFFKGDVVYLEDEYPEDERKVEYYMFDLIQDEMKYWVQDVDEANYSADEMTLIRRVGQ
jgi:hypothetical protein